MLKLLFYTDTHYRDTQPKSRIDDVLASQFAELGDIMNISVEHQVDALLHGGDFFDTKKPSHQLVIHLLNWVKTLNKPILGIIGNHDVTGYNLDSVKNSGLGVLFESGAVDKIDNYEWQNTKVVVKAVHSTVNFETEYMFEEKYKDYFKIVLSHNYVIPADDMPWGFIHPKDIKTNADLVLCGHYHVPYDYTNGKTRWINPGAISRWKVSERNHMPQVLLITVNDDGTHAVEFIPLPSAKKADEIFDLEFLKAEQKREQNIQTFVNSIEATSFQGIDIEQVILTTGKEQNIPQNVLDVILDKIREAKEILK